VDTLVEFEPQASDSFSNFLDLKKSLEALFKRSVDLVELRAILASTKCWRSVEESARW